MEFDSCNKIEKLHNKLSKVGVTNNELKNQFMINKFVGVSEGFLVLGWKITPTCAPEG